MTAEVLAVGTELLMGQIANTNAQYISAKLPDIGVNVYFHQVVGDNPKRLKDTLNHALNRSDVVIMTGGLGPTMDDLTKEAVAEAFGKKLVLDEASLVRIKERMSRFRNIRFPKSNEKQAYFPEGSIILQNDNGTAPGCIIENGGKRVVMLPGPPSEMRPMFDKGVMPYLAKFTNYRLESRFLRIFGVGESALEEILQDLVVAQTNPTIATYAKEGEVMLRLTARYRVVRGDGSGAGVVSEGCADGSNAGAAGLSYASCAGESGADLLTPMVDEVKKRLGHSLFSVDDENLEQVALKALIDKNLKISFAESCTGGLIAARLTAIPGSSEALLMSAVTYSNEAKIKILGVDPMTIKTYGAVSKQTAEEMASRALSVFGGDVALAVTGIAGPGGGSSEKPVGLVHLAIADKNGIMSKEIRAVGSRDRVRNTACLHGFDMIRRLALGLPQPG